MFAVVYYHRLGAKKDKAEISADAARDADHIDEEA